MKVLTDRPTVVWGPGIPHQKNGIDGLICKQCGRALARPNLYGKRVDLLGRDIRGVLSKSNILLFKPLEDSDWEKFPYKVTNTEKATAF